MTVDLRSRQPMRLAEQFAASKWPSGNGLPGLIQSSGVYWAWEEGRWRVMDPDDVKDELVQWLRDAYVVKKGDDGEGGERQRFVVRSTTVREVMEFLGTITKLKDGAPRWLVEGESYGDPEWTVAFEDAVVEVLPDGEFRTWDRTSKWFDGVVVPGNFKEAPSRPTPGAWMTATGQWGDGDGDWRELVEQWLGMGLVSFRGHGRWALFFGPPRGGKGTCIRMAKMMSGGVGYRERGMRQVTDRFLPPKDVYAGRHLVIPEVASLDGRDGDATAAFVKEVVGRDEVQAEYKYGAVLNRPASVQITMLSNEMLTLPDKNQGLSAKMLVVPFRKSWLKREDFGLEERLGGEVAEVAVRCLEAVGRWRAEEDPRRKWAEPRSSVEELRRLKLAMNPVIGFLEGRFLQREDGFVTHELLEREWVDFCKQERLGGRMGYRALCNAVELESGWMVRRAQSGAMGTRGKKGFKGMSLRRKRVED